MDLNTALAGPARRTSIGRQLPSASAGVFCRVIVGVIGLMGFLGLSLSSAHAASLDKPEAPVRILPLQILSDVLDDGYTEKLGKNLEKVLRGYTNMETLPVPTGDVLELLLEHDCIEPDLECLVSIGTARKVDLIFFATVTEDDTVYTLAFQVVDVKGSVVMKDGDRSTSRKAAIGRNMKKIVRDAFGNPPPPPPPPVSFAILSPVLNARVSLDGETIGMTPLNTKVSPGKYTLTITKKGYRVFTEKITVREKRGFRKRVKLEALQVVVAVTEKAAPVVSARRPVEPEPSSSSKPLYQQWWVWTAVGAVVVGGAITAVLLTQGDDIAETGSLQLSLQPTEVEQDAIFTP
jgi:hypothetical protein